jgi:hypothetical protein
MEMPHTPQGFFKCGWLVPTEGNDARAAAFAALFRSSATQREDCGNAGLQFVSGQLSFDQFQAALSSLV